MVVVEQYAAGGLDIAAQHVPDAGHQILAGLEKSGVGNASRRHDHRVGPQLQHIVGLGVAVEPYLDPEQLQLAREPTGDPGDLLASGRLGSEIDLAAEPVGGLEQDHFVTPQAGHPGRLHAADATTDHHHPTLRPVARRDLVRHGRFPTDGGIVDAERVLALVDAVDAVAHADTRADAVLLAAGQLGHDVRVGNVGSGHADHVHHALVQRPPRRRQIGYPRRLEHRQPGRGPHAPRQPEKGARRMSMLGMV